MQRVPPTVTTRAVPGRALGLGAIFATALLVAALWAARSTGLTYAALTRRATVSTTDAVPLVANAVLTVSLTWAAVLVLLSLRALRQQINAPGPGSPLTLPPGVVGRIATVLLAATLITSAAVAATPQAFATTHALLDMRGRAPVPGFDAPPVAAPAPTPGWTATAPTRATATGTSSAPLVTGCTGQTGDAAEVVVRRGDSLWTLVARHLHTEDPTVIAAQWPRWYAANRGAIGPDPDLIHVGQVLHVPPMGHTPSVRQGELR